MKIFALRALFAALVASALATQSIAQTIPRITPNEQPVYRRQHDVLVEAIREGRAEGVLAGKAAELFARQFANDSPLLVTAQVIESLAQPDCKRLQMAYTKHVGEDANGPQDVVLNVKLSYCADGRMPPNQEAKR